MVFARREEVDTHLFDFPAPLRLAMHLSHRHAPAIDRWSLRCFESWKQDRVSDLDSGCEICCCVAAQKLPVREEIVLEGSVLMRH